MSDSSITPALAGFRQPAEWVPHSACWLAWPSDAELWSVELPAVQREFTAFAQTITDGGRGERVEVLVANEEAKRQAEKALCGVSARLHMVPFGDIWLRDIAPLFLKSEQGRLATVCFAFNGWGGKYVLPHDAEVAANIAEISGVRRFNMPWVLEGGALDTDGEGTCLTTRQCLLNKNRNPGLSKEHIEDGLKQALGFEKILWLGDGLLNDHTDGHVDTIARFVSPGVAICMRAQDPGDPNSANLRQIEADLRGMTDARGRTLKVVTIPSPGAVFGDDGELMPASYANFYIANSTVIVPIYGSRWDDEAVRAIGECFPGRRTVGLPAKSILAGGGAFHCISQQQPL